jgi:hypothetical protein
MTPLDGIHERGPYAARIRDFSSFSTNPAAVVDNTAQMLGPKVSVDVTM